MARSHDPEDGRWQFLVTTNRGLEALAGDELTELGATDVATLYPGMIECTGPPAAVGRLNTRARSIHRVLLELARDAVDSLEDVAALVDYLDLEQYLDADRSIAVRAQRRGDHPFESPEVESRVGRAIVEGYRSATGERPPVDLDDPDLVFRVFVRESLAIVTVDTTGQRSLHRRRYRQIEHEAPIRPTMAAAMVRAAAPDPGERLVDPMCGSGTIPIEAVATDLGRPVDIGQKRAVRHLPCVDDHTSTDTPATRAEPTVEVVGSDIDEAAVAGTRENARIAGLAEHLSLVIADGSQPLGADVVVTDLPFGVRTDDHLRPLYVEFADRLAASGCRRAVLHTARPELLGVDATERFEMRRGRLETDLLVVDY